MSSLKLFHTTNSGVTEVTPRLAEAEADVQGLIEAHMETMLGVRFLASEYVIDCVDGGRIDSLGLDENNAKAVYPEEAIQAHMAFLARRRSLRPSEEYRVPTDEEWQEFLGHFERRKVSIGACGRAFGTPLHPRTRLRPLPDTVA